MILKHTFWFANLYERRRPFYKIILWKIVHADAEDADAEDAKRFAI